MIAKIEKKRDFVRVISRQIFFRKERFDGLFFKGLLHHQSIKNYIAIYPTRVTND